MCPTRSRRSGLACLGANDSCNAFENAHSSKGRQTELDLYGLLARRSLLLHDIDAKRAATALNLETRGIASWARILSYGWKWDFVLDKSLFRSTTSLRSFRELWLGEPAQVSR